MSYKTIEGYPNYIINYDGTVRNITTNRAIKPFIDKKGYYRIHLWCNGKRSKKLRVHRLVARAFIPNPDNKPQVNHKDCVKTNNHVSNLEWCTNDENMAHATANNIYKNRSGHNAHIPRKLTHENVVLIKLKLSDDKLNQKEIAKMFNVSQVTIYSIKKGNTWGHVTI